MGKLVLTFCLVLAVLVGNTGTSFALPKGDYQECVVGPGRIELLKPIALGYRYLDEKKYDLAFEIFLPEAKRGNCAAQNAVAVMYYHGHGVDKNKTIAGKWYIRSAVQGDPHSQYSVGYMYRLGFGGVSKNFFKAMIWWQIAAMNGDKKGRALVQKLKGMFEESDREDFVEEFNKSKRLAADCIRTKYKGACSPNNDTMGE